MIRAPWNGVEAIWFDTVSHDWGTIAPGQTDAVVSYSAASDRMVLVAPFGTSPDDVWTRGYWAPGLGGIVVQAFNTTILPVDLGVVTYQIMLIDPAASSPGE